MSQRTAVERVADEETVSERVIDAVAERTGRDPVELDPLYRAVDPEALDALFDVDGVRTPNRVSFTYCGCHVVVTGDGAVDVSDARSETANATS